MAPLQQELSNLEVEPLEIVEQAPGREGFDTPAQESNLETLSAQGESVPEVGILLAGEGAFNTSQCCCCCPACCC
jgi:hypothetical protein